MNVFILGNGFDLHNKLPTAYIDFLNTIQFLAEKYNSSMDTVGCVFGNPELQRKNENIRKSFEKYQKFYNATLLDADEVKNLIEKAKKNLWFLYLSRLLKKDLQWIDFEKEITRIIEAFDAFFNHVGENIREVELEKAQYLVSQFSFFEGSKGCYVGWFWDVDNIKDDYTVEFPPGSEMYEINKNAIIADLYKMLDELAEMLKTYLHCFVHNPCEKIEEKGYAFFNPQYPPIDYACTFNYTNTHELLFCSSVPICHIHGNVKDKIVLGVNPNQCDDLSGIDTSFIQFKKYFQRVFYKTDIEYLGLIEKIKCAKDSDEKVQLYVAGHSLDETDKDVIQELFKSADRITIFYHAEQAAGKYIKNLVSIYGKKTFDEMRSEKKLEFLPHAKNLWYIKESIPRKFLTDNFDGVCDIMQAIKETKNDQL